MRKFTDSLHQEMQLQIQEISGTGASGFDFYNACYQSAQEACKKLKDFILNYRFKDKEEEIEFFKKIKPKFQSRLMYFIELIQIDIQRPPAVEKRALAKYYRRTSFHYTSLAGRNRIFLHYIRTQLKSGDHLLFIRSAENEEIIHMDFLDLDDKFSTPASNELARIMCYEMVVEYLGRKVDELKSSGEVNQVAASFNLHWTGNKISLIELAYALQSSGAINMGKVSVAQITEALEFLFNINLGKYYRVFQNIRIRQGSRTSFLDELKERLTNRMDESDLNG